MTHMTYATHLNNLAGVIHAQVRYEEAGAIFRQALEIYNRLLGPEHSSTKLAKENLEGLKGKARGKGVSCCEFRVTGCVLRVFL